MHVTVSSDAKGTDYSVHNPSFFAAVHNPNTKIEFFVLRDEDPQAKLKVRVFFTRQDLELLRKEIENILEEARAEIDQNTEKNTT